MISHQQTSSLTQNQNTTNNNNTAEKVHARIRNTRYYGPFDGQSTSNQASRIMPNRNQEHFVIVTPLGSGQEVGRSCLLIQYKGKSVMLDCGLHPALRGPAAMPYFDHIDIDRIDLLLITHFHLDHSACLPYFLASTDFLDDENTGSNSKARCFMTHPTKSIYKLIVQDFIKVSNYSDDEILFNDNALQSSMDKIETIDYYQDRSINGIKFRAYHAGHVLGAAMFMIEIANVKILYTGDYSCDDDRHLKGAEIPKNTFPDILIIESTFGTQTLRPIRDREKEFTSLVHDIIKRGGKCLIPVFALGRAQELLLILEEYWMNNESLQSIPIYYASALAKKCLQVYSTYLQMMNPRIYEQYGQISNPFEFNYVFNLRSKHHFFKERNMHRNKNAYSSTSASHDPCVIFASPGMMQQGLSRELFELWCSDRRNGLIIPGYAVDGTMTKIVQSEPSVITSTRGGKLPLKMTVHYVMFAAHADHDQTKRFVRELKPPHVILVHGEKRTMLRVKKSLENIFSKQGITIIDPANCQPVQIEYRKDKQCKIVGTLVDEIRNEQTFQSLKKKKTKCMMGRLQSSNVKKKKQFNGLVVRRDFSYHAMHTSDLAEFTPVLKSDLFQSIMLPFNQSFDILCLFLSRIYDIQCSTFVQNEGNEEFAENETNNDMKENINYKLADIVNDSSDTQMMENKDSNANESDSKIDERKIAENAKCIKIPLFDNGQNLSISIVKNSRKSVKLSWLSSPISDMIADSIIGLCLTLDINPNTAIAQQMMQPVQSFDFKNNPQSILEQLNPMMPARDAFEFILKEHFGDENVMCLANDGSLDTTSVMNNIRIIRYSIKMDSDSAVIILKYNYRKMFDAQVYHQKFFEEQRNRLLKKKNENSIAIDKKCEAIEKVLDIITNNELNENYYEMNEKYMPTFRVESENPHFRARIESLLNCIDSALFPVACNLDFQQDFEMDLDLYSKSDSDFAPVYEQNVNSKMNVDSIMTDVLEVENEVDVDLNETKADVLLYDN